MQALGNGLVGKVSAAAFRLDANICFRHIAAPGSKKQSASTPTCNVRARLASIGAQPCAICKHGRKRARLPSLRRPASSICAALRTRESPFQLGAHRNRSASRRVRRGGVRPRSRPGVLSAGARIAFEGGHGGMLVRIIPAIVPKGRLAIRQAMVRRNCRVVMRHGAPVGAGGMAGWCCGPEPRRRDGRDRH